MSIPRYSKKHLLLAACIGAAASYGALWWAENKDAQRGQVAQLEQQIHALGQELMSARQPQTQSQQQSQQHSPQQLSQPQSGASATSAVDLEQLRKDLSTRFIGDPRTLGEKLRDFSAENPVPQTSAIVCKVIADLAENPDALGDQELDALYQQITEADVKRVVAQVMSLRGVNSLLDRYIEERQARFNSDEPAKRRAVLGELAKTRYAGAAAVIAPLLKDSDASVVLEALLALRATGNETHLHLLRPLLHHPDPSVSWLAKDAVKQLQNLSSRARTQLTSADIAAELPPF